MRYYIREGEVYEKGRERSGREEILVDYFPLVQPFLLHVTASKSIGV